MRVLLVEDNEGDAVLVETMLREQRRGEYELRHVTHLEPALAALATERPNVVVLDLSLPDATGLEGLMRIQQQAPRTPVVVMTGSSSEVLDSQAVQRGAHEYLVKGEVSAPLLARTLRLAVERSRMIEELKEAREAARHLATHDALTGIANRLLLDDRLTNAIANAQRNGSKLAVLICDLNRFKWVNDSFGHSTGDEVLRCVAQRLAKQVRTSDTIARFGGDEFAVVLTNLQRETDAARVAQKFLDALATPVAVAQDRFRIGVSVGIATFPRDGQDAEALLRAADLAMYHVKRSGASQYQFHGEEMTAKALDRLQIESRLDSAIRAGEFRLHYQPQVDLLRMRVVGAEALVRWLDPQMGLRSPATFLPVAEETGKILEIGEWVLRTACRDAAQWVAASSEPFRLAVNLSARQLRHVGFDQLLEDVLAESKLRAEDLTLEITETTLVDDSGTTARVLRELKQRGVRISIDDFGQGHAALAYLKRVPCDEIKIDRTFISGIPDDPKDASIASAIIMLAHNLGATTVAEGVETDAQLAFLEERGCPIAQGFLFGRPVEADAFGSLIEHGLLQTVERPSRERARGQEP
jgi:diguanylate cyclase (GGDEF)-like protein